MNPLIIAGIAFLAIFTQSVAGFGLALVSMPLFIRVIGLQTAAPLVAIFGFIGELILLIWYRQAISLRTVLKLALASVITVPLGVWMAQQANQRFVLALLGIVVIGYAFYALFSLRLPEVRNPAWAYAFGLVAGVLGGAYNVSGPPVVVYGQCRRWSPAEFKGNLQGFFIANSLMIIATHALDGNYTPLVWEGFLYALPGVALGLLLGLSLDRYLNPLVFRRLVLFLLIFLGLSLIL